MEALTDYFGNMPTTHRSFLIVGGLAFFFMVENIIPLFKNRYNYWKHAGINIFFTLTTIVINFVMAFLLVLASDWALSNSFGFMQWIELPFILEMILALMLMDFVGAWLVHYIEHHVPWMWKFHVVHHSDQHVDTTTANRHHPGESVFRFIFTILAVIIAGAPIWMIFLYQSCSLVLSQFSHSNIKLPAAIEKVMVLVFCTPKMHHVHHHYRMPYSDHNYGNIFSMWDRMFGTFIKVDNAKLKYGLDTHMDIKYTDNVWDMLKIPFQKYKGHIEYDHVEKL